MSTVITKNSQTPGKIPLSTDLLVGELAVNTANGKIYTKHINGTVVECSVSGSSQPDLFRMINPSYPISNKVYIEGPYGFTQILVYAGDTEDILLFTKTINYDSNGNITTTVTDDMINHGRLITVGGRREITTW